MIKQYQHLKAKWGRGCDSRCTSSSLFKSGKYVAPIRLYGIDLATAESFQITPLKGELPLKGTKLVPQIILTDDVADSFADPQTWEQVKDMKNKPLIDPMNGNIKLTFDYNTLSGQYTEGKMAEQY